MISEIRIFLESLRELRSRGNRSTKFLRVTSPLKRVGTHGSFHVWQSVKRIVTIRAGKKKKKTGEMERFPK